MLKGQAIFRVIAGPSFTLRSCGTGPELLCSRPRSRDFVIIFEGEG